MSCGSRRRRLLPARMQRIARDELHVTGEPYSVHDFLKPGIEEMCQLLPPFLAKPILRMAERKGWLGRVYFGMEVDSTIGEGLSAFPGARQAAPPTALWLSLQAGTATDRKLARL